MSQRRPVELAALVLQCPVEAALYGACVEKKLELGSSSHVTRGCCDAEFRALSACVRSQLRARRVR